MKLRFLLFVATLVGIFSSANAQTFNTVTFCDTTCFTNYSSTIVRVSSLKNTVVSYHHHGVKNEFILTDNNSVFHKLILPDGMYVRDFQIVDDWILFCGGIHLNNTDSAYVGFFKTSAFYLQPPTIDYYSTDEVSYFKKMVAYPKPYSDIILIETLGDYSFSNNSNDILKYNLLSDFSFNTNNETITLNYVFKSHFPYIPYYQDGLFQNITVTDKYLIVSGWEYIDFTDSSVVNRLCISKFNKYSVSYMPKLYYFDESVDSGTSSEIFVEHLLDDDIITSALHIDVNTGKFGIRMRTIDATTMTNTNTQYVPTLDKPVPDDMLFMAEDTSLLLLQNTDYPVLNNNKSVIYYIDPYRGNYSADLLFDLRGSYYSLDRFSPPTFIAAGLSFDMTHKFLMRYKPSNTQNCIKTASIQIQRRNNVHSTAGVLMPNFYTIYQRTCPVSYGKLDIVLDCQD